MIGLPPLRPFLSEFASAPAERDCDFILYLHEGLEVECFDECKGSDRHPTILIESRKCITFVIRILQKPSAQ
jgi:hypothetical protein